MIPDISTISPEQLGAALHWADSQVVHHLVESKRILREYGAKHKIPGGANEAALAILAADRIGRQKWAKNLAAHLAHSSRLNGSSNAPHVYGCVVLAGTWWDELLALAELKDRNEAEVAAVTPSVVAIKGELEDAH